MFYNQVVVFSFILVVLLLAIAVIDFKTMRIPNALNLCLAGVGIAWQFGNAKSNIICQLIFAVCLMLLFFAVKICFEQVTGKHGLGLGDVKMVGAAGIWISPFNYPAYVFIASALGLIFGLFMVGRDKFAKIPFGPFLALALFLIWVWENFQL